MKHLTPLIAMAAILLIPSTANAWDIKATVGGSCDTAGATIQSSNPAKADYKFRVDMDTRSTIIPLNYPETREYSMPSGVPRDGKPHRLIVQVIDHDGDVAAKIDLQNVVCAAPAPPARPPSSPPPPSAPPASPPAPPKVCVPSGTVVELHQTGPRSFALTGKAKRIRWKFNGQLVRKGGKRLTLPGLTTGRVVVKYRANCQPGRLVGEVVSSTPPETAG